MINRIKKSDQILNIGSIVLSGVNLTTDEFKQTLLLDGRPIVVPASNQFVLLPSEIGLEPPNFFMSVPYTGTSLREQYLPTDYIVTGWSVFLGKSGVGPAHLTSGTSGNPIWSPLTGQLYLRSPYNPSVRNSIADFSINSGLFASSGQIYQDTLTGNQIIGLDIYSGLSGAQDFSVILRGRYNDLYEGNVSQGVVMSSGDSSISFYSEYAATGNDLLEYYSANEFIATRWAVYVSNTGTTALTPPLPLTGRFYYRDPRNTTKTTITNFGISSGNYSSFGVLSQNFYIPFRQLIGLDISGSLNDIKNLNIVLGGTTIVSANYYKDLVTSYQFNIFSGYVTGLIQNGNVSIKNISTDTYDFIKSDIGKMVAFSGSGPNQTGFLKSSAGFSVGDRISIMQVGNSTLTVTGDNSVTVVSRNNAYKANGRYSKLDALYKDTNFWILYGDITT
jgi:hypothetical protein